MKERKNPSPASMSREDFEHMGGTWSILGSFGPIDADHPEKGLKGAVDIGRTRVTFSLTGQKNGKDGLVIKIATRKGAA